MFDLKQFFQEEVTFINQRLEALILKRLVTGMNIFDDVVEMDVCLPLSYLHHSTGHEENLRTILRRRKRLKNITDTIQKRERHTIYRWEPEWLIKPEEKQIGIEFYLLRTGQRFDPNLVAVAEKISDIYRGKELIVAIDKGYDLNFQVNSRISLIAMLNILRKYASPYVLDKDGLPIMDEQKRPLANPQTIPESYSVPVIIYRDRFQLFRRPIRGFKPLEKIGIIRKNEEISFYVSQAFAELERDEDFRLLQKNFVADYFQIPVYGNALFLNYLNQETGLKT